MTKKFFRNSMIATAALASATMTVSAHADADNGLRSWAKSAGTSVNDVMRYPALAIRNGEEGFTNFHVTVDRQGNVVASDLKMSANSGLINAAAKRVVKNADFPALPASYDGEKMTFSLQLTYAIANSFSEEQALKRQGRVTGREIASKGAPMVASIRILDTQGE